jgi:hypothetical protein
MGYLIKAVLGESLKAAEQEIERVTAAAETKGLKVTKRNPLAFEVGEGGRRETESVVDDVDLNWEKSAVYMEAGSAMFGNIPPAQ